MEISQLTAKIRIGSVGRGSVAAGIVGAVCLIWVPVTASPAWGQASPLPELINPRPTPSEPVDTELDLEEPTGGQRSESFFSFGTSTGIETGEVTFDGYRLFTVAAPAVRKSDAGQTDITPVERRAAGIEQALRRLSRQGIDPETLEVTAEIDQQSGLPIISINDQYLMTVTTLDANIQGQNPQLWASRLTQIIQEALVRAERERQPEILARQGLLASGTIVAILLGSSSLTYLQQRLKKQRNLLEAKANATPDVTTPQEDGQSPEAEAIAPRRTIAVVKQQLTNRQQLNLNDVQRRMLQVGQVLVWGGGTYTILGLFPYTRWLQLIFLAGPLRVLGVLVITYVVIRFSDVLIDRFFSALRSGEFLAPEVSQRLALRVSTFSQITKSITAVGCITVGFLVTLSVVGVDVIPLLAGAGIIGLAISFAAQGLIKDMINGFLILFEDQYAVGDVIVVGELGGLVENMTLRITQLRDTEGKLITLPNSSITVVQNLSKDWSRVDLTIDIAYSADLDHAIETIQQLGQEMYRDREWQEKILEPPEVLGVDEIDHAGVLIRVWIKTQPLQQWRVGREFRRRLKHVLDQKGIAIGVPQQSLWLQDSLEPLAKQVLDGNDHHSKTHLISSAEDTN